MEPEVESLYGVGACEMGQVRLDFDQGKGEQRLS